MTAERAEDPAIKRARVLAQLDLERQRRPRRDPIEDLVRRCERLEAAVAELFARMAA
jgi:hypothetical protein